MVSTFKDLGSMLGGSWIVLLQDWVVFAVKSPLEGSASTQSAATTLPSVSWTMTTTVALIRVSAEVLVRSPLIVRLLLSMVVVTLLAFSGITLLSTEKVQYGSI